MPEGVVQTPGGASDDGNIDERTCGFTSQVTTHIQQESVELLLVGSLIILPKGLPNWAMRLTIIWGEESPRTFQRGFSEPMAPCRRRTFGMCRTQILTASLMAGFRG